jgi:hypothetical protein
MSKSGLRLQYLGIRLTLARDICNMTTSTTLALKDTQRLSVLLDISIDVVV